MKHIIANVVLVLVFVSLGIVIAKASGCIIVKKYPHTYSKLNLRSEKVKVNIDDMIAETEVEQVFYNPSHRNLEGYFYFPLSKGSTIEKFSMFMNGKEIEAEMLEADKARKIYEDIVRKMRDPALLEFSENNVLKVRVFPIEARSEKKIRISYTEKLDRNNGTTEYQFLLKNKYIDHSQPNKLVFDINLKSIHEIKNIYSPTHDIDVVRKNSNSTTISFESDQLLPDDVFKLLYTTNTNSKLGFSLLTYLPEKENGFFMCNVSPGIKTERLSKDLAIVVDVSGSMKGKKMGKAKNAIRFILNSLNKEDRFNLIRFSTEATALFDNLHEGNKKNINNAIDFLNNLKAIGGTNIEAALYLALKQRTAGNRPFHVLFITDGKPTIGQTDHHKLISSVSKNNTENTRIFTLGIGTDINTHLLDKISIKTRAFRTYVHPTEDIEIKISDFYNKMAHPALTSIKITVENNMKILDVYPKDIPDLFIGESLTIFGRYIGTKQSSIRISGKVKEKEEGWTFKADFQNHKKENDFIAQLWAVRAVAKMLEQIRLNGQNDALKEEIIKLAKEYAVITPYTSYLILEDEQISPPPPRPIPGCIYLNEITDIQNNALKRDVFVLDKFVTEGERSVKKSKEYNEMQHVISSSALRANQAKMQDNIIQNLKTVINNGRAFYQNHKKQWIDSWVEKNPNLAQTNIQFGSEKYFELLRKYPQCARILALGNEVQFVMNRKIYNIFE